MKLNLLRCSAVSLCLLCAMCLTGCTASEDDAVSQALDSLSTMIANRANADQAKRDVKEKPSNAPGVAETKQYYDILYHSLNRYIDLREAGVNPAQARSLTGARPEDVQRDMMNFMSQAFVTLEPGMNTRSLQLDSLPVIPQNLDRALKKMKKSRRAELFNRLDKQIRLQPWEAE